MCIDVDEPLKSILIRSFQDVSPYLFLLEEQVDKYGGALQVTGDEVFYQLPDCLIETKTSRKKISRRRPC